MPFLDHKDENGVISKIEWTPLPEVKPIRSNNTNLKLVIPATLGEEVEELVREWYSNRGLTVPPWEIQACRKIDKSVAEEAAVAEATIAATPPKPMYGTPEFWKDWWAKKKAKEASGELPAKEAPKQRKSSVPKSAKLTGQASQK
uniref:Uncharacterized protein n=1 Tax=viral metagenome TaxID=1070528 RepID=A0A6C0K0U5_9ZZZZ